MDQSTIVEMTTKDARSWITPTELSPAYEKEYHESSQFQRLTMVDREGKIELQMKVKVNVKVEVEASRGAPPSPQEIPGPALPSQKSVLLASPPSPTPNARLPLPIRTGK